MASIDEIIRREANPFDPVTFKAGNFWQEGEQSLLATVNSIHQTAIDQVVQVLDQVATDHRSRTILLVGDTGSGKSYVLNRLKDTLNSRAFFVYVGPCHEDDYIWRHTLRQMVDSLMYSPAGEAESQILLWLKNLSALKSGGLMKKLLGEKGLFINNFRTTYPVGIYQAREFFGVLYALTKPELYFAACDWLRGENLDKEDLAALGVSDTINSESAAQGILANFGKISTSTNPIVLCFDQIESKTLPDGSSDIQPVFTVNTTFHNENLKNFLIILSIITDVWRQNQARIPISDKARIEKSVALKPISLDQAEALWASRLHPLHAQSNPKPESSIFPLKRQVLEEKFPGNKTTPRLALALAQKIFLQHKLSSRPDPVIEPDPVIKPDPMAAFKLLWDHEFAKNEQKLHRIRQFSVPELTLMLRRALAALQVKNIQYKLLLSPTYASYSFSYEDPSSSKKIGIIWTEEPNMNSFFRIMDACYKVEEKNICHALYLIRAEGVGKATNRGYKLYQQIFNRPHNRHIKPDITSLAYLATYDRLVNSVTSKEIIIAEQTLSLPELQDLVRQAEILQDCVLLQDIGVIADSPGKPDPKRKSLDKAKGSFLNFVQIHQLVGRQVVSRHVRSQFSTINDADIDELMQELYQENRIRVLDGTAPLEEQIICLVPEGKMA